MFNTFFYIACIYFVYLEFEMCGIIFHLYVGVVTDKFWNQSDWAMICQTDQLLAHLV